jgi:hypothetical protein
VASSSFSSGPSANALIEVREVFFVMTRRYFWQIPEFIKYRTVFETDDTVLGANENGEHQLFRKDTGKICFDERVALAYKLKELARVEEMETILVLPVRDAPTTGSYACFQ